MTRRGALSLVELALVTVALAASLGLLAHAADVDHTQWAETAFVGAVAALILLLPATLVLLLRAAWSSGPAAVQAVRSRVQEWQQWRGIQRAAASPRRPVRAPQDTMAVRPGIGRHAAGGAR